MTDREKAGGVERGKNHLSRGQRNTGPCSRRPWNQTAQKQPGKRQLPTPPPSKELGNQWPGHHSLQKTREWAPRYDMQRRLKSKLCDLWLPTPSGLSHTKPCKA